jgi:hypothetical protein
MFYVCVTIDGVWIACWIYRPQLGLHVIIALSLISTLHKSLLQTLSLLQRAVSSTAFSWQRLLRLEILQLPALRSYRQDSNTGLPDNYQLKWTDNSGTRLNSLNSAWGPRYIASGRTQKKTRPKTVLLLFYSLTCLSAVAQKWA